MLSVWLALVFLVGACAGGFLNVCIYRLPYEKGLLWPGWRCGSCCQPLRWLDALPLAGYWLCRGRCRTCEARFPARYFVVELLTGLCFAGLFYLDVVANVHDLPLLQRKQVAIVAGTVPWQAWVVFAHHALLVCFLLVASFIDIDHYEIPLPVTTMGTVVGLVGALLCPWPWPEAAADLPPMPRQPVVWEIGHGLRMHAPTAGLYAWPVWYPLPAWLEAGSWQLGLATGLAGVLAGTLLLRAVRFVFGLGRGIEGLGVGDADLMMMAGAFLGWQPVVIAFFVSVAPALLIGVTQMLFRGGQELAFGPSLSLGIVLTMLGWQWLAPQMTAYFFDATLLLILVLAGVVLIFVVSFLMRLVRGPGDEGPPKK
ncbi:MAG TPA: prepilin peptidase [Gemmataceae bacterium]|nr:prepilin peptidase [Gemmataceae bacterium]